VFWVNNIIVQVVAQSISLWTFRIDVSNIQGET